MSKASFIRAVIARCLPKQHERDRALTYAESLWDWLTEHGYGSKTEAKPRESEDWYGKLGGPAKAQFDRFWDAYAYKKDRNGAAMRWYQFGDLTELQASRIIDAARLYGQEQLPGDQVRKMAQGWLFEKRWLDLEPTQSQSVRDDAAVIRGLQASLAALKRLNTLNPNDDLARQIAELEARLRAARQPETES